ncbi:MAG: Alpha-1,3-mannosyltransferase-like protein [Phylliscum demangeonii]|nr:MAG: Alpha-1,3-mannosyltransferase-like protein [Phylliscum demangeonii]
MEKLATRGKKSVVFIHPDLGIGGAERLVIDAAVGLQARGHRVTIFTNHCDRSHCFEEASNGTLKVCVRGNSLVPTHILGRCSILCAILRQLHLLREITASGELSGLHPDVFFLDQLSACLPLLRYLWPKTRILFYCHFPDKLLAQRKSWVKRWYRVPFDWLEEWSTGSADGLVVNSKFTRQEFRKAFARLAGRRLAVVYPCVSPSPRTPNGQDGNGSVNREPLDEETEQGNGGSLLWGGRKVVLSINRFERKKGVEVALEAFAALSEKDRSDARLVIAGGYDLRVAENVRYHRDLVRRADELRLRHATTKTIVTALSVPQDIQLLFLLSVPASLKSMLLRTARLLVYTPANEHFGIVPLEAMRAGIPVLAANTGGPLETVVERQTGWLRPVDNVPAWTEVMSSALKDMNEEQMRQMGINGKRRVQEHFSREKMAEMLEAEMVMMEERPRQHPVWWTELGVLAFGLAVLGMLVAWGTWRVWVRIRRERSRPVVEHECF